MFISTAFAQSAGAAGGGEAMIQFLPLILIFVVFYFLLIRPQQKRAKDHQETLKAIRRGDRIVTAGGIIGTVIKVGSPDEEVQVEIAENVRVRVVRSTVSSVLARTEPVKAGTAAPASEGGEKKEGLLGKLNIFGRK
jgi:preprotein translocase subunit YajC